MKVEVYVGTYACGHVVKKEGAGQVKPFCPHQHEKKYYLVSYVRRYEER